MTSTIEKSRSTLTTPDLVVLALLCEHPMHGYQVQRELERREVSDWAGVSRPQIYYSLKKLAKLRLIRPTRDDEGPSGPERTIFAPTPTARAALADALDSEAWMTQRPPPPFVTWLALSIHAPKAVFERGIAARRRFLESQIEKETLTLDGIRADHGPTVPLAESIVRHAIDTYRLELRWLSGLSRLRSPGIQTRPKQKERRRHGTHREG